MATRVKAVVSVCMRQSSVQRVCVCARKAKYSTSVMPWREAGQLLSNLTNFSPCSPPAA